MPPEVGVAITRARKEMTRMTNMWEVISATSAAIQAIAVIFAIAYAARELRSAATDRHLALIFKLHDILSDPKARAARYYIFNKLPSEPGNLSHEDYSIARDTWDLMNLIGTLAHHNLASRKLILELYSGQAVRLWYKLEPHIKHYRMEQGNFAVHFEELAKMSMAYRKRHLGEEKPSFHVPKFDETPANVQLPADEK
jgi:hypothetical protein